MNENQEHDIKLTEFDYMLISPRLQMLKAAIPYFPPPVQRMTSILIKLQELQRAQSLFEDGELSAMGLKERTPSRSNPMEMIQAMKPYAGPKEREMIEMMENMQLMLQAMQPSGS